MTWVRSGLACVPDPIECMLERSQSRGSSDRANTTTGLLLRHASQDVKVHDDASSTRKITKERVVGACGSASLGVDCRGASNSTVCGHLAGGGGRPLHRCPLFAREGQLLGTVRVAKRQSHADTTPRASTLVCVDDEMSQGCSNKERGGKPRMSRTGCGSAKCCAKRLIGICVRVGGTPWA